MGEISQEALSNLNNASTSSSDDDIVVAVTGFGPFARYGTNTSWAIASTLPAALPLSPTSSNSNSNLTSPTPALESPSRAPPQIRIQLHPEPLRVSYAAVRTAVPQLWQSAGRRQRIDYMVHVGMAAGRRFYSMERRGHRDGYALRDVDGAVLGDEGAGERGDGDKWVWEGCPEVLLSGLDVDDVWQRWRAALPYEDVRVSEDAGHYLCDFIYYSSLAHLWKTEEERRVVFLHVPGDSSDAAIAKGREVLIELIRAVVESGSKKKLLAQAQTSA